MLYKACLPTNRIEKMNTEKRKGAKSQKDVSPEILAQMNQGVIESANLTEWLCVDHKELIRYTLPTQYQQDCIAKIDLLQSKSTMSMIRAVGESLCYAAKENKDSQLFKQLKSHASDSVRCWATYIVGADPQLSIDEKLAEIKDFAADPHFGVREISWMAVRESVTVDLNKALQILEGWSKDADANVRRFATESIRPNGVWCKKIDRLKTNPELALNILENMKSDSSKYVQDSVANWLNDASKTRPDFVSQLCAKWVKESASKETAYIVKRALRTINK